MDSTDLNLRLKLYNKSINSFKNNIFIGSFGEDEVGEHSTWLDFVGLYGLFSILFFIYLYNMYKFTKKRINQKAVGEFNVIWIYFIILGIVNTVLFAKIFLTLLLVIPLMMNLMYSSSKDEIIKKMDVNQKKEE